MARASRTSAAASASWSRSVAGACSSAPAGVVLTELGQRIAPKVRGWLTSTEQLVNDVRTSAGTPIGKVRIGSLPSTAHPLVTTLHRRLAEQYPLVQLAVRRGPGRPARDMARGRQRRSRDPVPHRSGPQGWRYLPRRGSNLSHERGRRSADLKADGTILALHDLPLVLFCRPSSWRDHLEQLAAERRMTLNVAWRRIS